MLEGGEDPLFIARRLVIFASEDVGNADPKALELAVAAAQAVRMIGLPECGINLAQITTYLACAPKSNQSHQALLKAQERVRVSHALPTLFKDQEFYAPSEIGFEKKMRQYLEWIKAGKSKT
jgi:putative ATPase